MPIPASTITSAPLPPAPEISNQPPVQNIRQIVMMDTSKMEVHGKNDTVLVAVYHSDGSCIKEK